MRWTTLTLLSLTTLLACGGGKDSGSTGKDGETPCEVDPSLCQTGETGEDGPTYMEPVAVGFEIDGTLYDDGTINFVRYADDSTSPPFIKLIFADADFFGLGVDQQAGHFCEIAASLEPSAYMDITPQDSGDPAFGTQTGTILNWSYDIYLNLDLEFTGTQCAGMVDPEIYGADALGLLAPFQGAHIGFGFAPMTDYLWDQWGGADSPDNADYVDKFFGMYVAVNDRDGHWGGCDWTTGLLFETDDTNMPVADADNNLIPLAVDAVGTGPLPRGYIRTFAYWYQDFPLMDFSNLAADPVPSQSWLCQ